MDDVRTVDEKELLFLYEKFVFHGNDLNLSGFDIKQIVMPLFLEGVGSIRFVFLYV